MVVDLTPNWSSGSCRVSPIDPKNPWSHEAISPYKATIVCCCFLSSHTCHPHATLGTHTFTHNFLELQHCRNAKWRAWLGHRSEQMLHRQTFASLLKPRRIFHFRRSSTRPQAGSSPSYFDPADFLFLFYVHFCAASFKWTAGRQTRWIFKLTVDKITVIWGRK